MSRDDIIACHPLDHYLNRIGVCLYRIHGGFKCRCPLGGHEDKDPSFHIKGDHWFCWSHPGGMASGTIIDLVMAVEGLTTAETMRKLGRQ